MSRRTLITLMAAALGFVTLAATVMQRRELTGLRNQQQQLVNTPAHPAPDSIPAATVTSDVSRPPSAPSPEVLELRSRVTQLMAQVRDLASVSNEHARLEAELAARGTNTTTRLPAGYIRTSEAQWVGLSTPENAIQSFLWTIRNRDVEHLVQVLTPESAKHLTPESLTNDDSPTLPGLRIVESVPQPDGSLRVRCEVLPGQEMPDALTLRLINGSWRVDIGH